MNFLEFNKGVPPSYKNTYTSPHVDNGYTDQFTTPSHPSSALQQSKIQGNIARFGFNTSPMQTNDIHSSMPNEIIVAE